MGSLRTALLVLAAAASFAVTGAAASEPGAAPEIAFVRDATIHLVRTDGTGLRPITRGYRPDWSPDGRRLVFVRDNGGNADVFVADADGRNLRRLTRTQGGDVTPAWSPDGTRIAFASNRRGLYRIFVMRADGTDVRAVPLPRATGNSFLPAWSPDGRLLAFSSSGWTPENPEIYSVRPDGKGLRRLTRTAGSAEVLGDDSWPAWSPDGRRIVFSSNRTGDGDIWITRSDGTGQRRLAGLRRRDDWAPDFSPDGRQIAFHSLDARGRSLLYVVRPDGTGLRGLGIAGTDPAWRPGS